MSQKRTLSCTTPLQVYHNQPLIAYLILKFVVTWVESQVAHLTSEGMATTLRFCVRLLEVYSRNNMGKVLFLTPVYTSES